MKNERYLRIQGLEISTDFLLVLLNHFRIKREGGRDAVCPQACEDAMLQYDIYSA